MTIDRDAVEIGKLYRAAREALGIEQPKVTDTRHFSEKILESRNADSCYRCCETFAHEQTRYPILDDVSHGTGWGIASICCDCFKSVDEGNTTRFSRNERTCAGCGEPIFTPTNARNGHWYACSNRCYQRAYRKRRRGRKSVIEWNGDSAYPRCEACKKTLKPSRIDAKFCSNKCRQWHYRRRKS
jgi:hypothetical protein